MKLFVGLGLMLTIGMVAGDLLTALYFLHRGDAFHYLTSEEQVFLVEVVAAAEDCKLSNVLQYTGEDKLHALLAHMPNVQEGYMATYVKNHLTSESDGSCIADATYFPPNGTLPTWTNTPAANGDWVGK